MSTAAALHLGTQRCVCAPSPQTLSLGSRGAETPPVRRAAKSVARRFHNPYTC